MVFDLREVRRAFILGVSGTIVIVGLFYLLVTAHPPGGVTATQPSHTAVAHRH